MPNIYVYANAVCMYWSNCLHERRTRESYCLWEMSHRICIHHQLLMKYFSSWIIFIAVSLNLSNLSSWKREEERVGGKTFYRYHSIVHLACIVQANCSAIKGIVLFYLMPFCIHINFETIGNVLRFIKKQQYRNINGRSDDGGGGGGGDGGNSSINMYKYSNSDSQQQLCIQTQHANW